jgi:hypothetical protein
MPRKYVYIENIADGKLLGEPVHVLNDRESRLLVGVNSAPRLGIQGAGGLWKTTHAGGLSNSVCA